MKVKGEPAVLSNYEVLQQLEEVMQERAHDVAVFKKGKVNECTDLVHVVTNAHLYLSSSPAGTQSRASVMAADQAFQRFNLSKQEKMVLLNERPSTASVLHACIPNIESRLSEAEIQELFQVIQTTLEPAPMLRGDSDDEGEQGEEEEDEEEEQA